MLMLCNYAPNDVLRCQFDTCNTYELFAKLYSLFLCKQMALPPHLLVLAANSSPFFLLFLKTMIV